MKIKSSLSWLSIGFALASVHYGLGFLVGSGEAIYNTGSLGILYAISAALGVLSLTLIAPFYWKRKAPIWDLLGNKYGEPVRKMVSLLSGVWMVGVVASQILGGSWALSVFGLNSAVSMITISILIYLMSIMDIGKLSKIFSYMLIFSSLVLLIILLNLGPRWFTFGLFDLWQSLPKISIYNIVGVVLSTILVTFIGMDFHQFLVSAKKPKDAILGSLFGSIILLFLSFLILALITGSIKSNLVLNITDPKQTLPVILLNFGKRISPILGIVFCIPIILVSIGSGSAVTKIVTVNIKQLNFLKKLSNNRASLITIAIALIIASTGSSIIELIVSFYAIYVASVIIPFVLYIIQEISKGRGVIPTYCVKNSLILGTVVSFSIFSFQFFKYAPISNNLSTYIMIGGIIGSLIGISTSILVHFINIKKSSISFVKKSLAKI